MTVGLIYLRLQKNLKPVVLFSIISYKNIFYIVKSSMVVDVVTDMLGASQHIV